MSKVITFSRFFPSYHKKKGQPTHFIEKFWSSISVPIPCSVHADQLEQEMLNLLSDNPIEFKPKHHTIRKGRRWKVGDKFSPRVWSAKPYQSKMIIIADDVELKKVYDFEINGSRFIIDGKVYDGEIESHHELLELIAINDGLEVEDLKSWFKLPNDFSGQILVWNDRVNYNEFYSLKSKKYV